MTKSRQPFMPLFFGDFLAATSLWDGEQQALYLLLLAYQWSAGPLPADIAELARVVRYEPERFARLWAKVGPKFQVTPGGLVNMRLEEHRRKSAKISSERSTAGKGGAAAKHGKGAGKPDGKPSSNADGKPADTSGSKGVANGVAPSHPIPSHPDPIPSPHSEGPPQRANGAPPSGEAAARAAGAWDAWRDVTECDVQAYEAWLEYREQAGDPVPPATRIANAKLLGGKGAPEAQRAFVAELIGRQFKRFHAPFHPIDRSNGSTQKPRAPAISAEQMEREIAQGLRDATGSVIQR